MAAAAHPSVSTGHDDRLAEAEEFARREVAPSAPARDRESRWDPEVFRRMGAAGLLGGPIPQEYGGAGLSAPEFFSLQLGFGRGCEDLGLTWSWAVHSLQCAAPIWRLGTSEQRERLLPEMCSGETVAAFADREPDDADTSNGIATRAVSAGDRWRLDGVKHGVIHAPFADLFVCTALTSVEPPVVSAFLVERDTPGVTVLAPAETIGVRTAPAATVVMRSCEVSHENLLGSDEASSGRARTLARLWERALARGPWVGLLETLTTRAIERLRSYPGLGRPAASTQSLRAALTDMRIGVEVCRRLELRAASLLQRGDRDAHRAAAVAALRVSEYARSITGQALDINADADDQELTARAYRDVTFLSCLSEPHDVLRSVIAGSLLNLG